MSRKWSAHTYRTCCNLCSEWRLQCMQHALCTVTAAYAPSQSMETFLLLCLIRKSQIKFSSLEYVFLVCAIACSYLFGVSVPGVCLHALCAVCVCSLWIANYRIPVIFKMNWFPVLLPTQKSDTVLIDFNDARAQSQHHFSLSLSFPLSVRLSAGEIEHCL